MNDQSFSHERPAEGAVSRLRRQWLRNGRDAFAAWTDDWSGDGPPTLHLPRLVGAVELGPRLDQADGRC